tara:strand:- start:305 stop:418 length:114 start_codon:yes stop_codon:yes gene_type:complete
VLIGPAIIQAIDAFAKMQAETGQSPLDCQLKLTQHFC